MLSGKFDLVFHNELERKCNEANYELHRISKAADAASNTPAGSERNSQAADLAKKVNKLRTAANRSAAALAQFPNPRLSLTNASYIFPESINTNLDDENKVSNVSTYISSYLLLMFSQMVYAAGIWAVMDRFGQSSFEDELDGVKIHRLSNILTLDVSLHTYFDRLNLWLEADPVGLHNLPNHVNLMPYHRHKLTPTASVVLQM
jgi:hypothetical protein